MVTDLQVSRSVFDIVSDYRGVLLDAYGVFWGGNAVGMLAGAGDAMKRLVESGKSVGILSNSTQVAAKEVAKLKGHGLIKGEHYHFLITSGDVVRDVFLKQELPILTPRKTFWAFGGGHPKFSSYNQLFIGTSYNETSDISEADFIYVSVPHIGGEDQTDPAAFREEVLRLKSANIPMVCANPDRFAQEGNPPQIFVRQGSIAAMFESMGGEVFYVGKPYNKAYRFAMQCFEDRGICDPSNVLMIGDTPETDIRGARSFGMSSALVTNTGMMAERSIGIGLEKVVSDLAMEECPVFFIESLS